MTKARTLADNFAADISGITAGTGITGGGTSGTVTITNDMATTIAAKGDIIIGSANDAYNRLAVGTNNFVLTADSAESLGVKWAAPSSGSFVGTKLSKSADQNLTNNVLTAITWDTEAFDTDAFHSTSTNTSRITIPSGKGGYYLVTARACFAGVTSNTSRQVRLYKNGSSVELLNAVAAGASSNGDDNAYTFSTIISLVATDYLEIFAYQLSGGTLAFRGDSQFSQPQSIFAVQFLGA